MKFKRIKETCIYIDDVVRTKAFYHGLLQLPVISAVENKFIFFRAGDSVLLCFVATESEKQTELPPHGARGRIHFAFEVERSAYDLTLDAMHKKNIPILHEQVWQHGIRSFYFHDPDENVVEVLEEGLWEIDKS